MKFYYPLFLLLALSPLALTGQTDSTAPSGEALRKQLEILERHWAQWEKDWEAYLAKPENDSLRLKLRREAAQYRAEMRALADEWKAKAQSDSSSTPYQLQRSMEQMGEGLRQIGLGLESLSRHLARQLREESALQDSSKN